jgi:hypothetical protein
MTLLLDTPSTALVLLFQILEDIDKHSIKIYEFPESFSDDDEEFKKLDDDIRVCSLNYPSSLFYHLRALELNSICSYR